MSQSQTYEVKAKRRQRIEKYGCNFCDFVAGSVAGSVGLLAGFPMDTVKVQQQTFGIPRITEVGKQIYTREGFGGFFKGLMYPSVTAGIINATFFGWYGIGLTMIHNMKHGKSKRSLVTPMESFLAGVFGGTVAVSVTTPIEMIKIQMQTSIPQEPKRKSFPGVFWHPKSTSDYSSSNKLLRMIIREHGFRKLYHAWGACLWRDSCGNGLYMALYQYMLNHYGNSFPVQFLGGGLAGTISWIITMPLDVVKSRLQADNLKNPKYHGGTWRTMKECVEAEGKIVLVRGMTANILRAFPVNSATFLTYSIVMGKCRERLQLGHCD